MGSSMVNRHLGKIVFTLFGPLLAGFSLLLGVMPIAYGETALEKIGFASLAGNQVQIRFKLSGPVADPVSFATDTPPRIALDFVDTRNALAQRTTAIDAGVVQTITAVEAGQRTRVVVNLARMVPYTTEVQGNEVVLTLRSSGMNAGPSGKPRYAGRKGGKRLEKLDFHRGAKGSGRILIKLSDPGIVANVREQGTKVLVDLIDTRLPKKLERRLDVIDFATPVKSVSTRKRGKNIRIEVNVLGAFEHLAYQSDDVLTIEVRPLTRDEQEAQQREKERRKEYTGDRLSLNFQDIEVRAVLQLLADFTGLNIVVSDEVSGSVTLRLKNVPWDQALDIVLSTKQLGMRRVGNVLLIAPAERLHAQEKQQLEADKVVEDLAPLRSEMIQLNYAKASDMVGLLSQKENSLMSERGHVAIDERTNTLLVQDTAKVLGQIRTLVEKLDRPVRQVLIESRIVVANSTFARELGVRFGFSGVKARGSNGLAVSTGSLEGTDGVIQSGLDNRSAASQVLSPTVSTFFPKNQARQVVRDGNGNIVSDTRTPFSPLEVPSLTDRLNVDLPVANPAGRIAMALLGADYLIDLELSALQTEGQGEVISNPRVLTGNNEEAIIEQGQETKFIARGDNSSSLDSIQALLQLKVTPTITPDDRVLLKLEIRDDRPGAQLPDRIVIDRRRIVSSVLVDNGETVVIGGIYQEEKSEGETKVPFLGDVPVLGYLFKTKQKNSNRRELLVFITPRIVKETLGISDTRI